MGKLVPLGIFVCLGSALAFACSSTDGDAAAPVVDAPDGSAPPGTSSGGPGPGGGAGDAGGDAGTTELPPPTPGKARLRVVSIDGAPLPDVKVVFHQPDGVPVATATSDAQGVVERAVTAGEMATALFPWSSGAGAGTDALTFVGVEVGDDLLARPSGQAPFPYTIPINAVALPANTGNVELRTLLNGEPGTTGTSCGASGVASGAPLGLATSIPTRAECLVGGTTPILGRATANTAQYFSLKAGGAPGQLVAVQPWTAGVTTKFTVTNAPSAGAPFINVNAFGAAGAGKAVFPLSLVGSLSFNAPGGSVDVTNQPPPAFFDAVETQALVYAGAPNKHSTAIFVRGPGASTYTFDFAGSPPLVTNVVATASAEGRPEIAFTWPPGAPGKGLGVMVRSGAQRWRFVAPPTARTLKAPALPAELAAWAITGAIQEQYVSAYETAALADYRAFRNQALSWVIWRNIQGGAPAFLPVNTTLYRVTGY